MDLPVIGSQAPERADAARNRERILEAAGRLFAERGVSCTSMDDIAAAAGVGKGTIFRRFGDRSTLALALLDKDEQALQEGFLRGPAPLGPGAPPRERLIAFGEAMFDNLERNGEVLFDAETSGGGSYMRSAPRAVHWLHVRTLVHEARPACDPDFLADVLLAPLTPHVFAHQRRSREMSLDQLKAGYADLVTRLLA
jgi:AcrR family transcriptional regulator